jgi:hypothetical protein
MLWRAEFCVGTYPWGRALMGLCVGVASRLCRGFRRASRRGAVQPADDLPVVRELPRRPGRRRITHGSEPCRRPPHAPRAWQGGEQTHWSGRSRRVPPDIRRGCRTAGCLPTARTVISARIKCVILSGRCFRIHTRGARCGSSCQPRLSRLPESAGVHMLMGHSSIAPMSGYSAVDDEVAQQRWRRYDPYRREWR